MDSTVSKQVALLKFKDALDALAEHGEQAKIVFAPDIIRDIVLSEPEGKNLLLELSGVEKDRLTGYSVFMRGGGHAMLGANAAIALRGMGTEAADVSILAKVYPKDRWELVTQYLEKNPAERGIAPANAEFVLDDPDKLKQQAANMVLARGKHTTIFLGEQPKLHLKDYPENQKKRVLELLSSADIVAVLSLKSDFMKDVLELCERGELRIPELFCDCTSGDEMDKNYLMLDTLRGGASGSSAIGLLSINESEARLFEMLLRREGERDRIIKASKKRSELVAKLDKTKSKKREAGIKAQIKGIEKFLYGGRKRNPFKAADALYNGVKVPLLMHTKDGACIIGGGKTTSFVPSVEIDFPKGSSFVGAGDTLCGALAIALAVKQKSDANLPENSRLSYEDCLLIANLATGYRLAKVNQLDDDKTGKKEWYEATGKVDELYGWASAKAAKRSVKAALPKEVEFVDVEKNSAAFGGFSGMDSEPLLEKVRNNCETNYWVARVAFEELCRDPKHMDALVEIVKDSSSAGNIFGKKAAHALAERGNAGVDALVETISSIDDDSALRVVSESVMKLKNAEVAAEIIFRVLCTGKLVGSFEKLMELITPAEFGRHVNRALNVSSYLPDFITEADLFRSLVMEEPARSQLLKSGGNLDLMYHLGLNARNVYSTMEAGIAESMSRMPKQAGMDDEGWRKFDEDIKKVYGENCRDIGTCDANTTPDTPFGKRASEIRERLKAEYGISDETLNNAIVLLLYGELGQHERHDYDVIGSEQSKQVIAACGGGIIPQYGLLWLLSPPFTEIVGKFFLWYKEVCLENQYKALLEKSAEAGGIARDFYRKILATCMIGKLVNPRIFGHPYDPVRGYTLESPLEFYMRRADDIQKMMSQWPPEQPVETAERVASKCSHRERDHFMKPMRHKRRLETKMPPERMKRLV
ncbi:MAG: hypothetical protein WC350_03135 [Candidatus Micrarchaeia archaeon]|jgi:hypothetical protein